MARDKEDQKAKDKITEGMSEAGREQEAKIKIKEGMTEAGRGASNQKAKDRITEGMSEAGKHPTDPLEDQGGGAPS